MGMSDPGVIERWRDRLPVTGATPVVTLGEGSTPLIPSRAIGPRLGVELHFKYEGMNPTGSFKDRGMTVAVSKARRGGRRRIVCASTGNTAASAAAYGARARPHHRRAVPGRRDRGWRSPRSRGPSVRGC
jgi:threonine synthase